MSDIHRPRCSKDRNRLVYFLNENAQINKYQDLFTYLWFNYLTCFNIKKKKEYKLFSSIKNINDNILANLDLIKYYKRGINYKYLKRIILSEQQRHALMSICQFKMDYRELDKIKEKHIYTSEDRNINAIKLKLKDNDIIDFRIKTLIEKTF